MSSEASGCSCSPLLGPELELEFRSPRSFSVVSALELTSNYRFGDKGWFWVSSCAVRSEIAFFCQADAVVSIEGDGVASFTSIALTRAN